MGAGLNTGIIILLLIIGLLIVIGGVLFQTLRSYLARDKTLSLIENDMRQKNWPAVLRHMSYAQYSKDFMPMYYMAKAYEGMKEYHNAAVCFEDCAVRLHDSDHGLLENINFRIAENFRLEGRIREAFGYYDMIDRSNHINWKVSYQMAKILYEMKNYVNAKKYVEEYMKATKNDVDAQLLYGKLCIRLNLHTNAIKVLNEVIESGKLSGEASDEAKFFLAKALLSKKSYGDAERLFGTLLYNRSFREDAFADLIAIYIQTDRLEEAQKFYTDHFSEVGEEVRDSALYEIASALWKAGSAYEAIRLWKEIKTRSPDFKDVSAILSQNHELVDYPFLENIFSKDEKLAANFLAKAFQLGSLYNVTKMGTVWIFSTNNFAHIFLRSPNVVSVMSFVEIEKKVKELNFGNHDLLVYALKGFVPECQDYPLYHKITKYSGQDFIGLFRASVENETILKKAI